MVEKYLKDTIRGNERQAMLKEFENKNLIPAKMRKQIAMMDSIKQVKEARLLEIEREKEALDTLEEDAFDDTLINNPKPQPIAPKPANNNKKVLTTSAAILTDERKNFLKKTAKA
jgi:hypothetical protein